MLRRRMWALVGGAVVVGAFGCSRGHEGADGADEWLEASRAPAIVGSNVRDGSVFRLDEQLGHIVVLSFGYTSCLEICPDTFSKAKALVRALGDRSRDVDFVYVTVDPERDTPAAFHDFMTHVDPRFIGVYIEGAPLAPLLASYGVTTRKRLPDPAGYAARNVDPSAYYAMDHTAGFWLIDRGGLLRAHLPHATTAEALVADVTRLLDGST